MWVAKTVDTVKQQKQHTTYKMLQLMPFEKKCVCMQ